MRWVFLAILILLVGGLIMFTSSAEVDAAVNMQGHRIGNLAAGLACFVVFSVIAVGTALLLAR